MIADNDYMTYAISKDEAKSLKFDEMPIGEMPEEVIQVMQYMLPYGKDGVIDPLSTELILQNEARKDSRIEKEIQERGLQMRIEGLIELMIAEWVIYK